MNSRSPREADIAGWRAWYEDFQEYTSAEIDWSALPADGIQLVKVYEDRDWKPDHPYTRTLDGCDWLYRAPDGRIEGVRSEGWDGYRPRPCGVPAHDIKRGTAVPDEVFARLTDLAMAATRCP